MLDTTELRLESPVERGAEWIKLPAALWTLAGAMLVIRSAEVFYVPIMPLYARMLNVGVPRGHRARHERRSAGDRCDRPLRWALGRPGGPAPAVSHRGRNHRDRIDPRGRRARDLRSRRLPDHLRDRHRMLTVAAMSYVSDITTTRNRATAMSIFSASTLAGAALGPFPGGYIAESFTPALTGYKATFFAGGFLKLLVGAYAFFMIREQRRPAERAAAKAGAPSGWGALANAAVLATCVSVFLFGIGFGAFLYFTVPVLGAQLGFTPSQVGWIVSGFGFGHVAGALAFGPLSDRMGRRALFGWTGILVSGIPIALSASPRASRSWSRLLSSSGSSARRSAAWCRRSWPSSCPSPPGLRWGFRSRQSSSGSSSGRVWPERPSPP
jgi:Major Facilitator Superfamily